MVSSSTDWDRDRRFDIDSDCLVSIDALVGGRNPILFRDSVRPIDI
jgi:hypothetical protein